MKYLFLFTITPVQSFIAQARKTQDLYAGSRLLSDLCRERVKHLKVHKGNLIFSSLLPSPMSKHNCKAIIEKQ